MGQGDKNMERKNVTNTARVCLEIWNVGLFALVWLLFYNGYAFDTYHIPGGGISILVYFIIYNALCQLYRAFRIASYQIGETVFSQAIAFGIADLILYIECCLIYNQPVNLLPGIGAVCLQALGSFLIVMLAKMYFKRHVLPKKTILIYGSGVSKEEAESFQERLLIKYSHLFDAAYLLSEEVGDELLFQKIDECHTVLFYETSHEKRTLFAEYCLNQQKAIYLTPTLSDIVLMGCRPKHLLDTPLLRYNYVYRKKTEYGLKRAFDLFFSLALLAVAFPFMLLTAIAIKIEDGGPVFYKQRRCTKDAREFEILKFRSMVVDAEKDGFVPCTSNDARITRVGKIIRRTRIDELPQIINILKGDMSFVGPRPERIEHVREYMKDLPEFSYRMRVKGGLTGYAQIFGKYNTSPYDKLRLDLIYIEKQSFLLDLKILMLTFKVVFMPESTEGFSKEKSRLLAKEGRTAIGIGKYSDIKSNYNI